MKNFKDKIIEKNVLAKIINLGFFVILTILAVILIVFFVTQSPKKNVVNYCEAEQQNAILDYNSETIKNTTVTLRSDIMNVIERNIERPEVQVLNDTFTLPGTNATVTFPSYPSYYKYCDIKNDYTQTGFYEYYKYMLLRQGMFLIEDCVKASKEGTLNQSMLFKHPAADAQYGAVEGTNNAVIKEITVDPTYKSYHTTGLYLPAGEVVKVKVENLAPGESISLVTYINSGLGYASSVGMDIPTYFATMDGLAAEGKFDEIIISSQWNKLNTRLPYMSANFEFSENKIFSVGTPFGGILHLNVSKTKSPVKITISGAVETPHYILGVTTPEYFENYLRNSPGVASCLDTENGILIGNDAPFRKIDDIENLALLWHSFFAVNESFTGGPHNANNFVRFDVHVPAGAAVHLGGGHSVCPVSWYASALNYESLLKNGCWGVLHEIAHGNGNAFGTVWGLGGSQEGEVRNNALTVLAYIKFLDIGTSRGGEHGEFAHAYRTLNSYMNTVSTKEDYNNLGYFEALSTYANIMHSFGVDKFYELMTSYQTNKAFYDNKRADFIYRCALIYGMDFRWYFNDMYRCNVSDSMFTADHLNFMKSLKSYVPIASFYEGGIDGLKTSGDIVISAGSEYIFDFKNKTVSPKNFSITKINQPKYGTLSQNSDGTYTYHAPSQYASTDFLSYDVLQENGTSHTFGIYIKINYNVAKITTYLNTDERNIDKALQKIKANNLQPDQIAFEPTAGIASYNTGAQTCLKISEFKYIAEASKEYSFHLKCDDATRVLFSSDGKNFENKIETTKDFSSYNNTYKFTVNLQAGNTYYFKLINVNFGGVGYANIGIKNVDEKISNLMVSKIFAPDLSKEIIEQLQKEKRVQNYYVSQKNNFSSTLSSNKSTWEVLVAPNHQNGETYTENQYDETGQLIQTLTLNKKDWLIDGSPSTIYHSVWSGGNRTPIPHEYTIDTKIVQPFNYYKIFARQSGDSLIKKYELFVSTDNVNYDLVSASENLIYSNYAATIKFKQTDARFLKLLVYSTTGQNSTYFSIIAEIDAGVLGGADQIIPVCGNAILATNFEKNQNNANLPTNALFTNTIGSQIRFSFIGDRFALFATKAKNLGSANIYIDGKIIEEIKLNSESTQFKQLVYNLEGLENKQHDVLIVSNTNQVFTLDFIGLSSNGKMLNSFYDKEINSEYYWCIFWILLFVIIFILFALFKLKFKKSFLKKEIPLSIDLQNQTNKGKYDKKIKLLKDKNLKK